MCMSLQLRFLQNIYHPHENKQTRNTGKTPKYEALYQMKSSTLQSDELERQEGLSHWGSEDMSV